jgi:lipopolysaccharide/colanic/teichoic acid biosynthesis glycosyltransferase
VDAGDHPPLVDRSYPGQRALDLVAVAVVAVPAGVIGLVCAVAVRLTSRGPVLFRQERIGHLGEPFELLKLRTMVDRPDNPMIPDASRITRVGAVLRRLSLDELPQLINVARGEMSVVGPRPTVAYQVARYDDRERQRLAVRPGLTGLAQLNGRNALSWADRIELDLEYVADTSWVEDLRILVRTPAALLAGSGVAGHPEDDPFVVDPDGKDE